MQFVFGQAIAHDEQRPGQALHRPLEVVGPGLDLRRTGALDQADHHRVVDHLGVLVQYLVGGTGDGGVDRGPAGRCILHGGFLSVA